MSMAIHRSAKIANLSERAAAYAIPGVTVDGNDVIAVYQAASTAVQNARAGQGPSLIEAKTYRWKGHSKSDKQRYRSKEEVKEWQGRDPIARLAARMAAAGLLSQDEHTQIEAAARSEIEAAVEYAKNSPDPDPATILDWIYA
jgi:pyruvate dehydrogenase E1 component alpha subunit